MTAVQDSMLAPATREGLKRAGNPFRNYFARNPDDDVCARYHVPELYAAERDLLLAVVDLYRYDPTAHSEVVPILGNKGAGKTHLLHSIKHGVGGPWQLLVTPGVFQKDTDFLEFLLYQIVDTLLGGGKQKGARPLDYVGEVLVRRCLSEALRNLTGDEKLDLFPPPGLGRWARRLGLGLTQAAERAEWLADALTSPPGRTPLPLAQALHDSGLTSDRAFDLIVAHARKAEAHNTAGVMRRAVLAGFARATLQKDEAELANFLTYGFAELDFQVRPTRQDLVLALFKVLMDVFRTLKVPVVVAFDQLEDLLLARRTDSDHKTAEAFFAGIVQLMHQIDGLCVLVFAERGLWNRFVPSLDGYIQDRLNNPVHVPGHGTVKTVRLEAPAPDLVRRVAEARLRPVLDELPGGGVLPDLYPFTDEQVDRIAKTEPTLRDMLQQFRHLFDHLVYGPDDVPVNRLPETDPTSEHPTSRIHALLGKEAAFDDPPFAIKNVDVIDLPPSPIADDGQREPGGPAAGIEFDPVPHPSSVFEQVVAEVAPPPYPSLARGEGIESSALTFDTLCDLWDVEFRAAKRKLDPDGALTAAARELQGALGSFLTTCLEHGVKVGPWRLQHVVPEWPFGDHPTYGAVTLAHWACKDGPPWKVGIGLFLARGPGKPKDLEIKLGVMDAQPAVLDHLILLRPDDDATLTGKSKSIWQEAERQGKHARLEPAAVESFALLSSFPRWIAAVREALPAGTPLPNLADVIQSKAERLLEQVCMPVQG